MVRAGSGTGVVVAAGGDAEFGRDPLVDAKDLSATRRRRPRRLAGHAVMAVVDQIEITG
jgi:hypothetical protein